MRELKSLIIAGIILTTAVLSVGCADNNTIETKNSTEIQTSSTAPVFSKSKTNVGSLQMDIVYFPAEETYKKYKGCIIMAEYTGEKYSKDVETEQMGDKFTWTTLYYKLKPVEYIYNPEGYELQEDIICTINYMTEPLFAQMQAGDHVILMIKEKGEGFDENEYMLNAPNVFYVNEGKLYSVLEEDASYDGMSLDDFKNRFN